MAYTITFLSLQFFEFYRADPDFRYQLFQILQKASERSTQMNNSSDTDLPFSMFATVKGLTPEAVASSSCVIRSLIRVSLIRWPIFSNTAGLLISFHTVILFLQTYIKIGIYKCVQ